MLTALYKRELGSFFFNYSAYFIFAVYMVFSLVFAVFVGMYFVVDNPAMRSYFAFQPLVLSVTRPAVVGRSQNRHAGSAFDPAGGRSDAGLRQICRGLDNGGADDPYFRAARLADGRHRCR